MLAPAPGLIRPSMIPDHFAGLPVLLSAEAVAWEFNGAPGGNVSALRISNNAAEVITTALVEIMGTCSLSGPLVRDNVLGGSVASGWVVRTGGIVGDLSASGNGTPAANPAPTA